MRIFLNTPDIKNTAHDRVKLISGVRGVAQGNKKAYPVD